MPNTRNFRRLRSGLALLGVAVALFAASLAGTTPALAATHVRVACVKHTVKHTVKKHKTHKTHRPSKPNRNQSHRNKAHRHRKAHGSSVRHQKAHGNRVHHRKAKRRGTVARKRVTKCHIVKSTKHKTKPPTKPATIPTKSTPQPAPQATPAAVVPTPVTGGGSLTTVGLPGGTTGSADPSAAPMPTGNLPGWTQVYTDDFTTAAPLGSFSGCQWGNTMAQHVCTGLPSSVATQLFAYPDGTADTSGHGVYEPSQVLSIHDGMLDYDMHTANGVHMASAVMPKIPGGPNGYGLQYGAYAVRFKADSNPGYKVAFLLWPDNDVWPQDGEIDYPEGELGGAVSASMHHMGATAGSGSGSVDSYAVNTSFSSWHTFVIEWTPTACSFILDGQVVGSSVSLIPNDPMHWVLQAETATEGAAPSASVTDHIYIDWIVAYKQGS